MSKNQNYNKMYKNDNKTPEEKSSLTTPESVEEVTAPVVAEDKISEAFVEAVKEETESAPVETNNDTDENTKNPNNKDGVVTAALLNVRQKPDKSAEIVIVLNKDDKVSINIDESNDKWFKVYTTDGVDGYCMKEFITIL